MDATKLAHDMKEDGMSFRWSAWDMKPNSHAKQYKLLPSLEENDKKSEVSYVLL